MKGWKGEKMAHATKREKVREPKSEKMAHAMKGEKAEELQSEKTAYAIRAYVYCISDKW